MEAKEIIKLLVDFIAHWGVLGFLAIVVLLLIHNPERAVKLKAIFFEPIFRLTRWGSKQYIGAQVSSQVTEFLRRSLTEKLSNKSPLRIKVKWVTSPSDPVLKKDGSVILRMRETADQTRNVLVATQLVLPYTTFPTLRSRLDEHVRTAIDLAILNKLALKLGSHARAIFQRHLVTAEVERDKRVGDLFAQLVELDSGGLFVSIFLEELEHLDDTVYVKPDFVNKSDEVCRLLDHLLTVARKKAGQDIELIYQSPLLNIGIILVAKSVVAEAKGVGPYLSRLQKDLKRGCETVYLIAYAHKESFLPRVMRAVEQEDKVIVDKETTVNLYRDGEIERSKIVRLHRNTIFVDDIFEERLRLSEIELGDKIEGTVSDVSPEQAMVVAKGLPGRIVRRNASWSTIANCNEVLALGDKLEFKIIAIRKDIGELQLSLRILDTDPWKIATIPSVGEVIRVEVARECGSDYLCKLGTGIEVLLPKEETSWISPIPIYEGAICDVKIYDIDHDKRVIRCSLRRLVEDPWPMLHVRFPKGSNLRGTVVKTTPKFVHVDLGGGIIGGVPRARMIAAGYEYASYEKTVVPGQQLDVVVAEILVRQRVIRLDLQRNVEKKTTEVKRKSKASGQK